MRIYIIGYMGSGKSYFARQLAQELGFNCCDMDELFENKTQLSIDAFFKKHDENTFRLIEKEILHQTAYMEDTVIAAGGGTPCFFDNMDFMLKQGICIYLTTPINIIVSRLHTTKLIRPLLAGKKQDELFNFVKQHLAERQVYYNQAQLHIDPNSMPMHEIIPLIQALNAEK